MFVLYIIGACLQYLLTILIQCHNDPEYCKMLSLLRQPLVQSPVSLLVITAISQCQ